MTSEVHRNVLLAYGTDQVVPVVAPPVCCPSLPDVCDRDPTGVVYLDAVGKEVPERCDRRAVEGDLDSDKLGDRIVRYHLPIDI